MSMNVDEVLKLRKQIICLKMKELLKNAEKRANEKDELSKAFYLQTINYVKQSLEEICGGGE